MKNCVNCGAVLHGNRCEYCGTEYSGSTIVANFWQDEVIGTIEIAGAKYQCYLSNVETTLISGSLTGRGFDGRMHLDHPRLIHKFVLVEV